MVIFERAGMSNKLQTKASGHPFLHFMQLFIWLCLLMILHHFDILLKKVIDIIYLKRYSSRLGAVVCYIVMLRTHILLDEIGKEQVFIY